MAEDMELIIPLLKMSDEPAGTGVLNDAVASKLRRPISKLLNLVLEYFQVHAWLLYMRGYIGQPKKKKKKKGGREVSIQVYKFSTSTRATGDVTTSDLRNYCYMYMQYRERITYCTRDAETLAGSRRFCWKCGFILHKNLLFLHVIQF